MRLGVASAARPRCGVRDFVQQLAEALPADIAVSWVDYPEVDGGAAWRRAARAADGLDVVHVHYEYGLFRTVKPYRNRYTAFLGSLRPPVVVTLHDALPRLEPRWHSGRRRAADLLRDLAYLPFFSRWDRTVHRGVDHWVVHSQGVLARIEPVVAEGGCTYTPHPIPRVTCEWRPRADEDRVMVTPGFVKPHKGYDGLAEVLNAEPSWSWVIAGEAQDASDHEYLGRLRTTLASNRLEDQVRITGYLDRPEMEARVCAADLAVFPYTEVTGSGAVAWAIGCGIPIVTTDLPEFRFLRSRGAGIELLPIGARDQWPELLKRLLDVPARLERLAQRNREYAAANSFETCALVYAEIFARAAGRGTQGGRT